MDASPFSIIKIIIAGKSKDWHNKAKFLRLHWPSSTYSIRIRNVSASFQNCNGVMLPTWWVRGKDHLGCKPYVHGAHVGSPSRRNTPHEMWTRTSDWLRAGLTFFPAMLVFSSWYQPKLWVVTLCAEPRLGQRLTFFLYSVLQCFGLIKWKVPCSIFSSIYIKHSSKNTVL